MILDETLQRGAVLRDEVLLAHVHDVVGLGTTDLKIDETSFMLKVLAATDLWPKLNFREEIKGEKIPVRLKSRIF